MRMIESNITSNKVMFLRLLTNCKKDFTGEKFVGED